MAQVAILLRHFKTKDDELRLHTPYWAKPQVLAIDSAKTQLLADELALAAHKFKIRTAYISDTPQARETADHLLPKSLDIVVDKRLRNMLQPEWEGMPYQQIQASEIFRIWRTQPEKAFFMDGESLEDVRSRIEQFLENASESFIAISHTTPLQVLALRLLGLPATYIWRLKFDFNSLSLIADRVLLRHNSAVVSDMELSELHQVVPSGGRNE